MDQRLPASLGVPGLPTDGRLATLALVALGLLTLGSTACGGTHAVHGQVVYPAEVPIRSFPRIWVVGGETLAEIQLADALATHLAGDADVRVVPLRDLEPARLSGRIPPATVVVLPRLAFEESSTTQWTSRPQTVCGTTGCYTRRRSYQYQVATLAAELTVTVYDGPTAVVQQEVHLETTEEGRGYDVMRTRSVATFVERLGAMVDQRVEELEVILLDVDLLPVERAIREIEAGDWSAGRQTLEAAMDAARGLPPEDRARVLYDLGMARLYDTAGGDEETRFRRAAEALEAAIAIDPQERYRQGLAAVAEHRGWHEEVRQQHEAAEHNYRVGSLVPEPPAAYGRGAGGELPE